MYRTLDANKLLETSEKLSKRVATRFPGAGLVDVAGYLQLCTELLSLVSKIGHLYVQDFPDATSLNAVDQVETLATGLSNKIWQKIQILDRIRSQETEGIGDRTL